MTLILDTGALVALEKNDRAMWRRLKSAHQSGDVAISHGGVIGQAWRGNGSRQALLAKALQGIEIRPLDETLGRSSGALLAASGLRDVIDAAVVLLANDGDRIVTSDLPHIQPLAEIAGCHIELIAV